MSTIGIRGVYGDGVVPLTPAAKTFDKVNMLITMKLPRIFFFINRIIKYVYLNNIQIYSQCQSFFVGKKLNGLYCQL